MERQKMTDEKKKIKLLVVDDEVKLLESISKRLSIRNFDVTTASNGKEAVKVAKGGKYDLAILDLKMPKMGGEEVLKILKKRHKFLEILILTGHASTESTVECMKLGAFDYLEKPCEFDKLVEKLKEAYEARLMKKFKHDKKRMDEIKMLSMGDPLGALKTLIRVDDDEK
jgi:DNA-binding NtrC family response regulator